LTQNNQIYQLAYVLGSIRFSTATSINISQFSVRLLCTCCEPRLTTTSVSNIKLRHFMHSN